MTMLVSLTSTVIPFIIVLFIPTVTDRWHQASG